MTHKSAILSLLFISSLLASCGNGEPADDNPKTGNADSTAYIDRVFDCCYAPGQHASTVYSASPENFAGKPSYLQEGTTAFKQPVSLGGWGGYITGGFRQDVENRQGTDFIVLCGVSNGSEPAVVYVMADDNGNSQPDDTWYELQGSESSNPTTVRHYRLTYYKPDSPEENIKWKDNQGNAGELQRGYGSSSTASWWKYADRDSLMFAGTRLPDAYFNAGTGNTENWKVHPELFTQGYAENAKGTDYNARLRGNEFDISHAIDSSGQSVSLKAIRFIKIQTAVFQQAGWLNEISTEVFGAADLSRLN